MKRKDRNFLMAALAIAAIGATAAGCESASVVEENGPEYEFTYNAPLRAEYDSFVNIDGKLDEDFWKDQQKLYWVGGKNNLSYATAYFTSKGLYVGMYAEDDNITWQQRYTFDKNSYFNIQVVKTDEINYNDSRNNFHPARQFLFNIDAKNSLSRMERQYEAASYYEGELNGETTYMSAELFVPWSEIGYSEDELNEAGVPESIKLLVQYRSYASGASGFPGFTDDESYKTYYTYDANGSTCEVDFYSETDTAGYSVGGWTPGDQWNIDQENKTARNTAERTQILWLRKDVDGNAKENVTDFVAGVKIKTEKLNSNQYPVVGFMTLKSKTVFNICGLWVRNLYDSGTLRLSTGRATDGSQWLGDQRFSATIVSKDYAGATFKNPLTGEEMTCEAGEAYLSVVKRGQELYYFVNGEYVGMEYDDRLDGECVIGLFANGIATVSDWNFKDYGGKQAELDTYLNKYVWFLDQSTNGYGNISMDKLVAKHGETVNITVTPNPGYILTKLTFNDGDNQLDYFLETADQEATFAYEPSESVEVYAEFSALDKKGMKETFFKIVDGNNNATKLLGATYVIRGDEPRLVYKGSVNNKGNIVTSLLEAGTYIVAGQEFETKGEYTIELSCDGYITKTYSFSLPKGVNEEDLEIEFALQSYPFGSVSVNGVTASGNSLKYVIGEEENTYSTEDTLTGTNRTYLKNAVFKGDYIFDAKVSLMDDALYSDVTNLWTCGAVVGFELTSGGRYISFKTAAWISGKLYLNYNGNCEIGLSGFDVTNEEGNSGFNKAGASQQYRIARYNDVIYVYNVNGELCFTLSSDGIELVKSAIVEGSSRLETFNAGVASFFKDGDQNAFGLGFIGNGKGAYEYVYSFSQNADDLKSLFKTTDVKLKSGENYGFSAEGKYTIGSKFLAESNVTLKFSNVPDNGANYVVAVQFGDNNAEKYFGTYDKDKKTIELTVSLKDDATVWLEKYELGEITVNGNTTGKAVGTLMTKQEDGSYKSEYDSTGLIRQFYTDKTVTGDYYLESTITVVDKTPANVGGWAYGSGVGLMVSTGEYSLCFFTNSWEGTNLLVNVGGKQGGAQATVSGFGRDNNLKAVGNKINFKLIKVGDVLYVYNSSETLIFHIDAYNGIVIDSSTSTLSGTPVTKTLIQQEFAGMVNEGKETAFGIYREYNAKSAYAWKADVVTDSETIANTKYDWDNQMYAASSVTLNGATVNGTANAVKYQPSTATYSYVGAQGGQLGFVTSTETKQAIVTDGDYIVRVKMSSDNQSDFRIYSGNGACFTIRTGVSSLNSKDIGKYSLFFKFENYTNGWFTETGIGSESNSDVFANPCNTKDTTKNSEGELDLMIVRYNNKISVYGCDYLKNDGTFAKKETWTLLISFDSEKNVTVGEGLKIFTAWGNESTAVNNNFNTAAGEFFSAGTQNAFAMTKVNASGGKWKVTVTEGTDKAKAFTESPSAVD